MRSAGDDEPFETIRTRLYSAVISDVLDACGRRDQTMDPSIRPLDDAMVVVGRAKTVQATDVHRIPARPYAKQIEVLDAIQPGDVFVAGLAGSRRSAFFGELMATATSAAGGRGAVVDGLTRDAAKIRAMGFPLFCTGCRPTDSLGRNEVVEYDAPIECGGVTVNPGDLIFGDIDGVVVVPRELEERVIALALEKVSGENRVRQALREGMKVSQAFATFGLL